MNTSLIRDFDNSAGIDLDTWKMEEELKLFDDVEIHPKHVLIRLYIKPNKTASGIILNNALDVYEETCGYIAAIGKCAFTGEKQKEWGEWYKKGDWFVFPRHSGLRFTYKKLPVFEMFADMPMLKIQDPRFAS